MGSSLNWSIEHCTLCSKNRSFASLDGCFNRLQHLVFRHIWSTKDIQHGCNIHTNGTLEFYNFFHTYLNIAVDIRLEGTRIRHNDAGKIDEIVNSFLEGMLLQIIMLPNDVGVSDESLNSVSIPHLSRLNGSNVWIDDRKKRRSFKNTMGSMQLPNTSTAISCDNFEFTTVAFFAGLRVIPSTIHPCSHSTNPMTFSFQLPVETSTNSTFPCARMNSRPSSSKVSSSEDEN